MFITISIAAILNLGFPNIFKVNYTQRKIDTYQGQMPKNHIFNIQYLHQEAKVRLNRNQSGIQVSSYTGISSRNIASIFNFSILRYISVRWESESS
ncbi:uncharacterized protein LOC132938171 isoform X3 [Metopolophium dirhodum]|uniref:uncharacterized protein LOC132938171 isoform X3 n=1 Tax=Metopolophium dirhodum TaxID=44670 RepID=UPI0029906044|nr:uncharacterized protein LOC132938171 isoform X3 [Metopolophium dirhodum]